MRIRLGCELSYSIPKPTPMIVILNVHYSRFADLERPDHLVTDPPVPVESSGSVVAAGLFVLCFGSGVVRKKNED